MSVDAAEGLVERFLGLDRLGQDAHRAQAQGALGFLVGGDDLDRDVARHVVVLEAHEDAPAVDVGEVDVERDRIGAALARQVERGGAARRDQGFEVVLVREVHEDADEVRIVLDNQQDAIAELDVSAVVGEWIGV